MNYEQLAKEITRDIQYAIDCKKMSLSDLAEKTFMSVSSLSQLLNRSRNVPKPQTLEKIAAAAGVEIVWSAVVKDDRGEYGEHA